MEYFCIEDVEFERKQQKSNAKSCYNITNMNSPSLDREKIVKQAIANEKLEGLKVSPETRKIADGYVVGKASAKAAADKIRTRYGIR